MHKLPAAVQEILELFVCEVAVKSRHAERHIDDSAFSQTGRLQVFQLGPDQEFPVLIRPDQAIMYYIYLHSTGARFSCKS